jgi:tRNA modification GTPase
MNEPLLYENDVIAAISTPPGRGAIGVVRLSGAGAVGVAKRFFTPVKRFRSHRMYYGSVVHDGKKVDEVMLCCMLAPKSFTREDVVEVYAHGGTATVRGVLDAALGNGARLALPGEFTKRAFLNGRLNLAQAEAVMDVINAGSDIARAAGLRQLGGGLSGRITACRDVILRWLAHISLSIDYPEHEDEADNRETIITEGRGLLADMQALLQTAKIGRVLREGIKTAIVGAPNAGKSTLLNAILGEDRAITHELPGTTRDVLTEQVFISGIPLVLMDTAGLRETDDPVEKMGLERTFAVLREAELILHVIDGTDADFFEYFMANHLSGGFLENIYGVNHETKKIIVVLNKSDLSVDPGWDTPVNLPQAIPLSAKTGQGLDKLYEAIKETFLSGMSEANIGDFAANDIITRERHKQLLDEAIGHLTNGILAFTGGIPEDIATIHLRSAYLSLGHILGLEYADDIIDRIFAEFCVGK